MATDISTFKAALPHGGARPTLFDFRIDKWGISNGMPPGLVNMKLYCNVSAIPALTVTPIERIYFGRTVKIPGDMVFADLTTSLINTENYEVRNGIEEWMAAINHHSFNVSENLGDSGDWQGEATLTQYSKDGSSLMKYKFIGLWPQTLAEIALSYDTVSDIETFDVTWSYNYYTTTSQGSTLAIPLSEQA